MTVTKGYRLALVWLGLIIFTLLLAIVGLCFKAGPDSPFSTTLQAQGWDPYSLGDPTGAETLSVTTAATAFTAATRENASRAYCTVETVSIRYRVDGTNPTTTVGHLQLSSATSNVSYGFWVNGKNNVIRARLIATSGTASVFCTYFK